MALEKNEMKTKSNYIALSRKSHSYLCTQITASTMPDLSISIAMVVTIPVHWAPTSSQKFNYQT